MQKLALIIVMVTMSGCSTMGGWASSSMDWADRTFPTYDDLFGDVDPNAGTEVGVVQRQAYPAPKVEAREMSRQQEVYYDNSERGYSFEK